MNVTFSTTAKRRNSTKQPTGGTVYPCKLKEGSSSLRPSISLQWSGTGSPVAFNTCYIPTYGRYYWVNNWTYQDRQWWADCEVDVLASYKTEIGATSKFILRADGTEDPKIMDGKYPSIFPLLNDVYSITGGPTTWATDFSGGRFIVNVVGNGNTYNAAGGSYYSLTALHLQQLINAVFTETDTLWQQAVTPTTDLAEALNQFGDKWSKSISNPAQFINSIYWVPFVPTTSGGATIKLGTFNTYVVGDALSGPVQRFAWVCNIPIPTGVPCWKLTPPYTSYTLYMPPFGTFELDARRIFQSGVVNGYIYVDVTNGESILEVYDDSNMSHPFLTASAQVGTPVQLSGSNVNYAGLAKTALNTAGGIIGSVMRGDVAGAITGGASGIISTAEAAAPVATNGGYGGGLAALYGFKGVVKTSMTAPTQDPADEGYPVLDVMTISYAASGGSGYVLCADGAVDAAATPEELAQIDAFLRGGFFYE